MSRLNEEIERIPSVAWAVAAVSVVCVAALFWVTTRFGVAELLIMGLIAAVFATYILIIGYIASDARRRGMPVLLWTLLAIFIPSAIGIVLYFILRRPLLRACEQCGKPADATYTFCPSCGATLGDTCPSCHISVESSWAHCPKCGVTLGTS